MPFPPSALGDEAACALVDPSGHDVAFAASALSRWPDGSIKWLFVECTVPPGPDDLVYLLDLNRRPGKPDSPLGRTDAEGVSLRSGSLVVRLARGGGVDLLHGHDRVGTIAVEGAFAGGPAQRLVIDTAAIEWNGSQRVTAIARGTLRSAAALLNVTLRLSTYAGSPQIRCDLTIHNPQRAVHRGNYWELGDAGSVLLGSLAVVLRPAGERRDVVALTRAADQWEDWPDGVTVYQESSGGPNWASTVHVDRSGQVPMRRNGYVVTDGSTTRDGLRVQPAVCVAGNERAWTATLLRFWEEFPSAIAADPSGTVTLGLFPGSFPVPHEIQGGERKARSCVFAHGDRETASAAIVAATHPPLLHADPAAMIASGVLPFLDAPEAPWHQRILEQALQGERSFFAKRERIDEYGWRHFGDLLADHESAFLKDGGCYVSHYNNQYDAVAGFGWQFLRTGDGRWWRLMDDLARHVSDVDIYHTTEDKPAYNNGLFWHTVHYVDAGKSTHRSYPPAEGIHGGGPAAEHNYNVGLALHYFLTGWAPSRDAAVSLAQWVIDMDDGRKTPLRWLTTGETGFASASGSATYHGPGRGGGNSILALLVAFEVTGDQRFLDKAERLIRRCVHPADDLDALNLLDAERRWYYTVFLEAIGRYLLVKRQHGQLDARYDYARRTLLHYARWMCDHEYPYLDKPGILEFPTETWSAQDIRKSDVLAWAALCTQGAERQRLLDGSRRFLDDVSSRLPSLPTHDRTRPLVLMLTRGYVYDWVCANDAWYFAPGPAAADGSPSAFVPQKMIAIRRLKVLAGVAAAAALTLLAVAIAM